MTSPQGGAVWSRTVSWWTVVPFLAATVLVAGLGSLAATSAKSTYDGLVLPWFAPPGWLFGPVWSVLYLFIAVAGWLLWRSSGWDRAVTLWVVQLVLNLAWTPVFFAGDRYGWALLDIVVLALVLVVLIAWSWGRSRAAAWLLVPYLAWVSFAATLNLAILRLN